MRSDDEASRAVQTWEEWCEASGLPERSAAPRGDAPQALRGVGIDLAITSEACPVQIAGTVDGAHLFFRARSGEWRCAIDPEQDTARRAGRFLPAEAARYCAEGDDPDNGRMPHAAAWQIVREAVEAFRAGAVTR